MKYLITLSIVFLFLNFSIAHQNNIKYYLVAELKKFEGEWKSNDSNIEFTLNLKVKKTYVAGIYADVICGTYMYKNNGTVLPSTTNAENPAISIGRLADKNRSTNELILYFDDPHKNKRGNLFFTIDPKNPLKASWTL